MSKARRELPIPAFYDAKNAEKWDHRPDHQLLLDAASDWQMKNKIKPAGTDKFNLHLLLIDVQKDFCFPEGTLYVAGRSGRGAIEDSTRMAEFIYRNLDVLSNITVTMDTHFAYQIFFTSFWIDAKGEHPAPHMEVTLDMIKRGELRPNPAVAKWLCEGNYTWLRRQVEFYCDELERGGKYKLYLWPYHCMLGSDGHALVGAVCEARMFHSFARGIQSHAEIKGTHPLTENYSVISPEVLTRFDGKPLAQKNTKFLETLFESDALVIGGQAASHCVKSTIDDLLGEIMAKDPELVKKVYIMTNCMSAVTVPDGNGGFLADFMEQAEEAHKRFADAGMHLVKSTDPIEDWPDIKI